MTIKWTEKTKHSSIKLAGKLNYVTIMVVYSKFFQWLESRELVEIDFSDVQSIDSAGVALLINWYRYAKRVDKRVKYCNLPKKLDIFLVDPYLKNLFNSLQK